MKFVRKLWKIFGTQTFGLGQISYHFILLMNKIFDSAQASQLPKFFKQSVSKKKVL